MDAARVSNKEFADLCRSGFQVVIIAAITRHRRELFWGQYALIAHSLAAAVRVGATAALMSGGVVKELRLTLDLYDDVTYPVVDTVSLWVFVN